MEQQQHPILGTVNFRRNKRAKRIILRVKAKEGIVVTLPARASYKAAWELVNQHITWIQTQQKKLATKKTK